MSDSSDDSFAWTYVSNPSDSSDEMTAETMNNSHHSESESEKGYKKKLHKKLFKQTEADVKSELLDEKAVKREQESDVERGRRKRKRKRESSNHDSAAVDPSLDHYLELRVKQECYDQQAQTNNLTVESVSTHARYSDCKGDDNLKSNESRDTSNHKSKKKKSKRRKESLASDCDHTDFSIEDKFTAEETIVQYRPHEIEQNGEIANMEESKDVTKKRKKSMSSIERRKEYSDSRNDSTNGDIISDLNTSETVESNIRANENMDEDFIEKPEPEKSINSHQIRKISERIQFEDEINYVHSDTTGMTSQYLSRLRRFLKVNPHLQSITNKNDCESLITKDDDVWLFSCPHEMNITSLKGEKFSLDNKCKIKVENQTYVGNVDNDSGRVTILLFEGKKPIIKNIALNGFVNFHKRIPKAHFIEDNVMLNNQTDFIPLPDTKCRHPLFGSDYKKAMKIPSSIKTRLHNPYIEAPSTPTDKKKRKKHKFNEVEMGSDQSTRDGKMRRKRKLSGADGDQSEHHKPKRIKSEEAWDSEKAIEEKLFNF